MKILILTSKFGQGHYSVAKALEEEFQDDGHQVIVSDVVEIIYAKLSKIIYFTFNNLVCRNSSLYNCLNEFGRNPKDGKGCHKSLVTAISKIKPDLIITTWSACARMIGRTDIPLYICITDVGVHPGWIHESAHGYLVASQDVAEKLIAMNIKKDKIQVCGIPVKKQFYNASPKRKSNNKILIMGGGLGILPWIDELINELHKNSEIKITVIAGSNQKLYRRLVKKYSFINVVGFTKEVYSYMRDADLLVSKPGGVSIFEGICSETPCIAVYPEYKHEIENAHFILNHQIGQVIWKGQRASEQVIDLLKDTHKLCEFKENQTTIKEDLLAKHNDVKWGESKYVI